MVCHSELFAPDKFFLSCFGNLEHSVSVCFDSEYSTEVDFSLEV